MHIRPLETSDFHDWLRMRQTLWPDSSEEEARVMANAGERLAVFVAERISGGLAGFIEVGLRDIAEGCESSPVGYIEGWYVDADMRLTGIGGRLVQAAESWARARGCAEIASDCAIDNAVSLAAHLALGFDEAGRVICFRKRLDD